jgi:hypothetical protein
MQYSERPPVTNEGILQAVVDADNEAYYASLSGPQRVAVMVGSVAAGANELGLAPVAAGNGTLYPVSSSIEMPVHQLPATTEDVAANDTTATSNTAVANATYAGVWPKEAAIYRVSAEIDTGERDVAAAEPTEAVLAQAMNASPHYTQLSTNVWVRQSESPEGEPAKPLLTFASVNNTKLVEHHVELEGGGTGTLEVSGPLIVEPDPQSYVMLQDGKAYTMSEAGVFTHNHDTPLRIPISWTQARVPEIKSGVGTQVVQASFAGAKAEIVDYTLPLDRDAEEIHKKIVENASGWREATPEIIAALGEETRAITQPGDLTAEMRDGGRRAIEEYLDSPDAPIEPIIVGAHDVIQYLKSMLLAD